MSINLNYGYGERVELNLQFGLVGQWLQGETDATPPRTGWLVNAGSRIELSERFDAIMSFGRFVKAAGPGPEAVGYAGVTVHL